MNIQNIFYAIIAITVGETSLHRLYTRDMKDFTVRFILYILLVIRTNMMFAHMIFQTLAIMEAILALTVYKRETPKSLPEYIEERLTSKKQR